ncbi:MAG: DUF4398 domain-containing protein [Treponema sp.]|nr:DUF4398 domain-containing protein [Treponema sp.]
MKSISCIFICAALVCAVLFVGCAKPPTDEMNRAAEAVTRAENDNDAVTYAANSLARARDALAKMYAEANSKRYDAAKSLATEALNAAERAINEGRTGAARARDEAAAIVSQLPSLVVETEQGLSAARISGLPLDFSALNSDFAAARSNADQAQTAFSDSQYQDAINRGRSARAGLNDINQQLSSAVTAARKK